MKPASIGDYRELARRRLPKFLFEYIDGGSYDEITLKRNREDLAAVALRQRVFPTSIFRPGCSARTWPCRSSSGRWASPA